MALGMVSGRFQFQRATKKEWEDSNLILLKGELAIESDTSKIKIGDGRSYYPDLPYILVGEIGLKHISTRTEEQKKEFIEKLGIREPDLTGYVEKVDGKGLSTEDFTSAYKTKLEGIETGAQKNKVSSVNSKTGDVIINKSDLGLGMVENIGIKILTQSQYDALSDTEKNRSDILYGTYKE